MYTHGHTAHIHIWAHMCTWSHTYMYTTHMHRAHRHTCMWAHVHIVHMCTCTWIYRHTYMHMSTLTHIQMGTHMHTVHTCTHTGTHIHTHGHSLQTPVATRQVQAPRMACGRTFLRWGASLLGHQHNPHTHGDRELAHLHTRALGHDWVCPCTIVSAFL